MVLDSEEALDAALKDKSVVVTPGENLGDSPVATPAIKGYRQLSPREIQLINASKEIGNNVGVFLDRLNLAANMGELEIDKRFLSLARTYLQLGFMAVNRSIAKPESF